MRRAARDADRVGARHRRLDGEPVHWSAFLLGPLGEIVIDRERKRHLAGGDHVGEQRMTLAHRHAVACHQLLEKFYARIATEFFGHCPEPLLILGLDAELALPLWIE